MNFFLLSSLLSLATVVLNTPRPVEKAVNNYGDTTVSESRIKLYPTGKPLLRPGLSIDPKMPVAKPMDNSRTPVVRLDVNSNMPVAKLEEYIDPTQPIIIPKSDSTRKSFKWPKP